jgi:hypothetical protein
MGMNMHIRVTFVQNVKKYKNQPTLIHITQATGLYTGPNISQIVAVHRLWKGRRTHKVIIWFSLNGACAQAYNSSYLKKRKQGRISIKIIDYYLYIAIKICAFMFVI